MARPTERLRNPLSRAVIELRIALGETQQAFAARLGTAIATVARYETSRPPSVVALVQLALIAQKAGRSDLVKLFMSVLGLQLRFTDIQGGHLMLGAFGDNPRGYMLLNLQGKKAQGYAQAFFETFQRFM